MLGSEELIRDKLNKLQRSGVVALVTQDPKIRKPAHGGRYGVKAQTKSHETWTCGTSGFWFRRGVSNGPLVFGSGARMG